MKKRKHIISFSGGLASFFEAKLAVDKYGIKNVELVFCDTKTEDEDLYRFLDDAETYFNKKITRLVDGRDIWECAFEDNFLYNSRVANCSKKLKMRQFRIYIKQYKPEEIVIHIGYDWTEIHRYKRSIEQYKPYELECLLIESELDKSNMKKQLEKMHIDLPRLYKMGFAHNNCGGFCFRAGIGHFKQLYDKLPERYDYHMNQEQKLIKQIGKDVSILTKTKNGVKYNITLKELKKQFEQDGTQLSLFDNEDMYDIGGCECFVDFTWSDDE